MRRISAAANCRLGPITCRLKPPPKQLVPSYLGLAIQANSPNHARYSDIQDTQIVGGLIPNLSRITNCARFSSPPARWPQIDLKGLFATRFSVYPERP